MLPQPSTASRLSPLQQFARLPEEQQNSLLEGLTDEAKAKLAYEWRTWIARPSQIEPPGDWLYWLILAGRGFGKTRSGAEWVREQVKTHPRVGMIGKDASDMRSVMIDGESGVLAVCPPWERPVYLPSRRLLKWPNGALSELRTGEDPEGVRGIQFDRLWADEIAAWQYAQETWDMALMALRLGEDPRACITTTPKPIRLIRDLVHDPHTVVTSGTTFDNLDNLAKTFHTIIGRYEGTRLGRQELYAELLEDEGLAYRFSSKVHVVAPFPIPDAWARFESLDYGWSNPSAWIPYATDYEGNIIVFGGLYEPGLPSQLVPLIKAQRTRSAEARDEHGLQIPNVMLADPSMWTKPGITLKLGQPASAADEFADLGIPLAKANNDRRAGFLRVSERLRYGPEVAHKFPQWHERAGEPGSPSLFIFDNEQTVPLREQLADAPLETEKERFPGEAVSQDWEGPHGHAHACFVAGTLVATEHGERPIESIRAGERVWTRHGLRHVAWSGCTGHREVVAVSLSNGRTLVGTPDHLIWLPEFGWRPLSEVRYADKCCPIETWRMRLTARHGRIAPLARFGALTTARSRRAGTSTTGTATRSTTASRISKRFRSGFTRLYTKAPLVEVVARSSTKRYRLEHSAYAKANVARRSIASTVRDSGRTCSAPSLHVTTAAASTKPGRAWKAASARTPASLHGVATLASTTKRGRALSAPLDSSSTATHGLPRAAASAPGSSAQPPAGASRRSHVFLRRIAAAAMSSRRRTRTSNRTDHDAVVFATTPPSSVASSAPVFDLSVEIDHEFFAEGVLVHNSLRYGLMSRPSPSEKRRDIPEDPRAALMALHEAKFDPDDDLYEDHESTRYTSV